MLKISHTWVFATLVVPMMFFSSCRPDGVDASTTLHVSSNFADVNNMGLVSTGAKPVIEVKSEVYWTLNIEPGGEWLTTDVSGGYGESTISLNIEEYLGDVPRTARLCFETLHGTPRYFDVLQRGVFICSVGGIEAGVCVIVNRKNGIDRYSVWENGIHFVNHLPRIGKKLVTAGVEMGIKVLCIHACVCPSGTHYIDGLSKQGREDLLHLSLDGGGVLLYLPATEAGPSVRYA